MGSMKTLALALGLLAVAAGCRSTKEKWPSESHSIVYLTNSLHKVLEVTNERAGRSPTNRLEVEVAFRNTQPKPVRVQISTTFLTEDGAETGRTNFRNFMLSAHETKTYRTTSLNDAPDGYLIQVRRLSD